MQLRPSLWKLVLLVSSCLGGPLFPSPFALLRDKVTKDLLESERIGGLPPSAGGAELSLTSATVGLWPAKAFEAGKK
jgi:hypothetical protein